MRSAAIKMQSLQKRQLLTRRSKMFDRKRSPFLGEAGATRGHVKQLGELFRKNSISPHPVTPTALIELPPAQRAQAVQHPRFLARGVVVEPLGENVLHCMRQPQQDVAGPL